MELLIPKQPQNVKVSRKTRKLPKKAGHCRISHCR